MLKEQLLKIKKGKGRVRLLIQPLVLDSGRGAEHRVGYHRLISNKREWNNCFIKNQTLYKNISNFIFYRLEFSATLKESFP